MYNWTSSSFFSLFFYPTSSRENSVQRWYEEYWASAAEMAQTEMTAQLQYIGTSAGEKWNESVKRGSGEPMASQGIGYIRGYGRSVDFRGDDDDDGFGFSSTTEAADTGHSTADFHATFQWQRQSASRGLQLMKTSCKKLLVHSESLPSSACSSIRMQAKARCLTEVIYLRAWIESDNQLQN